jgi:hypothetical protein
VPYLTKITRVVVYEPSISLDQTLRRIIEYYES